MAKRKNSNTRTRVVTRAKKVYSRARSGAKGFGKVIEGGIAGALSPFATKYLGKWGQPAVMVGVGHYMKNDTLETIGGFQIGQMIGAQIGGAAGLTADSTTTGGYL